MFYLLNFKNHSFQSHDFPEQVSSAIQAALSAGVCEEELEVVNASVDEMRMDVKEFQNTWGEE